MTEEQELCYSDDETLKHWSRIPQDLREVVIEALRGAANVFQGVGPLDQSETVRYLSAFQMKVGEAFARFGIDYNIVMNDRRHPFCIHPSQPGAYFFWNLPIFLMYDDSDMFAVVEMLEKNL